MSKLEEEYQIVDASGAVPIAQTVPEVTRVKVIAPSDLQAGYRLHVHVNGVPRTVIVVSSMYATTVLPKEFFSCKIYCFSLQEESNRARNLRQWSRT